MASTAVFVWVLIGAWALTSYLAWRRAAQRGLYGPMVNICAILCPLVLLFVAARQSGGRSGNDVCRTCYRRGCTTHMPQ